MSESERDIWTGALIQDQIERVRYSMKGPARPTLELFVRET